MPKNKKTFPTSRKFSPLTFSGERELLQIAKEKVEITDSGDSDYLIGNIVNYQKVQKINQSLIKDGKKPIDFKNTISLVKVLFK